MRALIAGNWKRHRTAAQLREMEAILEALEAPQPAADALIHRHAYIRQCLVMRFGAPGKEVRILYGGSVDPENARDFLAVPEGGGALIGVASLKANDFDAIVRTLRVPIGRFQHSAVA